MIIDYLDAAKLLPGQTILDYQTLLGFWLARQGRFDDFLFDDVSDNHAGPGLNADLTPNLTARLQIFNYAGTVLLADSAADESDLIARPFDEPLLFRIASAYEAATKHPHAAAGARRAARRALLEQ